MGDTPSGKPPAQPPPSFGSSPPGETAAQCGGPLELAVEHATQNIPGLPAEQAKVIFSEAFKRDSSVVFGGSRVRGNYRAESDLDTGFGNLSSAQAAKIIEKASKVKGGLPLEKTRIVPGNETKNIPKIESPEEFFMRSGERSDPGREGEPFHASGYIAYSPDGKISGMNPDGTSKFG